MSSGYTRKKAEDSIPSNENCPNQMSSSDKGHDEAPLEEVKAHRRRKVHRTPYSPSESESIIPKSIAKVNYVNRTTQITGTKNGGLVF